MRVWRTLFSELRLSCMWGLQEEFEAFEGDSGARGLESFVLVGGGEAQRPGNALDLALVELRLHN